MDFMDEHTTEMVAMKLREKIYYPLCIFFNERVFHILDPVIYWMEDNKRFYNEHIYWFLVDRQEELTDIWYNKIERFLDHYFAEPPCPYQEQLEEFGEPYHSRF